MIGKNRVPISGAALLLAGVVFGAPVAYAGSGQITMELAKAAFIVGGSGGKGTLTFEGQTYPLSIGGFSAGYQISLAMVNLSGGNGERLQQSLAFSVQKGSGSTSSLMLSTPPHSASPSWLAAQQGPAATVDALTAGWWIELGGSPSPQTVPTLRRIVLPPQRTQAL